jgi:hypothetical protein
MKISMYKLGLTFQIFCMTLLSATYTADYILNILGYILASRHALNMFLTYRYTIRSRKYLSADITTKHAWEPQASLQTVTAMSSINLNCFLHTKFQFSNLLKIEGFYGQLFCTSHPSISPCIFCSAFRKCKEITCRKYHASTSLGNTTMPPLRNCQKGMRKVNNHACIASQINAYTVLLLSHENYAWKDGCFGLLVYGYTDKNCRTFKEIILGKNTHPCGQYKSRLIVQDVPVK